MPRIKAVLALAVLFTALSLAFLLPKPRYSGVGVFQRLDIPVAMTGWLSRDFSGEINLMDERYRFVSGAFTREYANRYNENLLFIVLDAGNFHNPKTCFRMSGAQVRELPGAVFMIKGRRVPARVVYTEARGRGTLIVYWMCVDGKLTDWAGQKFKEFQYTLFNKKKAGLMVRMDIPVTADTVDLSLKLAGEFLRDLSNSLDDEQMGYLFGAMEKKSTVDSPSFDFAQDK